MRYRKNRPYVAYLIVGLILLLGLRSVYINQQYHTLLDQPVDASSVQRVNFTVPQGSVATTITNSLEQEGLISRAYVMNRYLKENHLTTKIQSGRYLLQANQTIPEITEILTTGRSPEIAVTILEGWTVDQIDARLANLDLADAGEFSQCAQSCDLQSDILDSLPAGVSREGYFFPDTYYVDPTSFTIPTFAQRLLDTTAARLTPTMRQQIETNGRTIHQTLTVASLLEREMKTEEDMKIASDIIYKRLDTGEILGIDATVRYITGDWSSPLTLAQLNINSPYNTRKFTGLPPTPIGNPGLDAISAAIYPTSTQYWYYLHPSEGEYRTIWAETNDQHNRNKQLYLK